MYFDWLKEKVRENNWENKEFMIWAGKSYNYKWLLEQTRHYYGFLNVEGIKSGCVCALKGDYSPDIVSLFLALIENKNTIVPISFVAKEKEGYYIETSQAEFLLESDNQKKMSLKGKTVCESNKLLGDFRQSGHAGLILFTSGSTGLPKAALHNLDTFLESYFLPKKAMRTLVFLHLDHIGGINTLFSLVSNGGTMIVIKERDPEKICQMIEKYKVELLPTTPSFLNLLLISEAHRSHNLSSLKLITYGTEVMPESLLKKLNGIFPGVTFKQTYGLTEVGILKTKSRSSDSPWVRVGGEGYQTKVVNGILWIKAKTSIVGYLNAPSPFTEVGWMITNDRVEVDGEYLRFLGRQEDIINVGGLKVFPIEVENIILEMEEVQDILVYAEANPILGNIVCAKIRLKHPENVDYFRKKLYGFCKSKIERYKIPQKIVITDTEFQNERFKKVRIP